MKNKEKIILFLCASIYNTMYSCGILSVHLRKPLTHYRDTYNNPAWGLQKAYMLMQKQYNHENAGLAVVKFNTAPGMQYMHRIRSTKPNALSKIFNIITQEINDSTKNMHDLTITQLKNKYFFLGNAYIGHMHCKTCSNNSCQPYLYKNKIKAKTFSLVGNFTMTNLEELFQQLINSGLDPTSKSNINIIASGISYCLDREHLTTSIGIDINYNLEGQSFAKAIATEIDLIRIIRDAARNWDGGYVLAGLLGNGNTFICRDPAGIRPMYYYMNDEVVATASERVALAQTFNIKLEHIHAIKPGHTLIIKKNGDIEQQSFTQELPLRQCALERMCISRINDPEIYKERKVLGNNIAERILKILNYNLEHVIFDYIPTNNNKSLLIGMLEEIEQLTHIHHAKSLWEKTENKSIIPEDIDTLANCHPRSEHLIYKNKSIHHCQTYDVIQEIVLPHNTLVIMINTTMQDINTYTILLNQLMNLNPKRIIFVCACPPTMYPDYYGINTNPLDRLIAFQATIELLHNQNKEYIIKSVAQACANQVHSMPHELYNAVQELYNQITHEQLERKIAQLIQPTHTTWRGEINILYQTIDGLHHAMPNYTGDWHFTGNYPTPGGYKALNTSFLSWCDKNI